MEVNVTERAAWWRWVGAFAAAASAALVLSAPGCADEGPAEEVGEEIDEAADEVGDAIEDAAD